MVEKKIKSIEPLGMAVAADGKKGDKASGGTKRGSDKHRVEHRLPKWYPGRISSSHEGMIW